MDSDCGVFLGIERPDWALAQPPAARGSVYAVTGDNVSAAAGRVSFALGLQGLCESMDTACTSKTAFAAPALRLDAPTHLANPNVVAAEIRQLLTDSFHVQQVSFDAPLMQSGLDSFDLSGFVDAINAAYNVQLPATLVLESGRIGKRTRDLCARSDPCFTLPTARYAPRDLDEARRNWPPTRAHETSSGGGATAIGAVQWRRPLAGSARRDPARAAHECWRRCHPRGAFPTLVEF